MGFLDSNQKVFLLLGDSGAGKSTFNRQLDYHLWQSYKKSTGIIPLHINLPAIDKLEQDMIAKQLRKSEFTEPEIRELKVHRKFILICDGYDESHQTHNLYVSNRLNQPGEWNAQMLISCRSEYLGVDYRYRFQPGDRNQKSDSDLFQEAVITPFSADQINDYIDQYVTIRQPLWEAKEYKKALELIPSLKDLVKNPFLMTLSLEVLPRMVDPGQHLTSTHVTRVALYDHFIDHWLERGKKRLAEKELSPQAKVVFESLIDEGFTRNGIDFLKKLAVAIYKEQGGQPIVKYSRFKDGSSWKAEFFSHKDEKQLLREACPLTRSGNQHRFIHRSLLEYGLALAIFDPRELMERAVSGSGMGRRGSMSSTYSFEVHDGSEDGADPIEQGLSLDSPLATRSYINEPSLLQFLEERVQQEPVFKQQLLAYIEHSKTDEKWRTAAANAITILVRAGVQFNSADLRRIRIPGADLSYAIFDSAQLQGADLRRVNFRNVWLLRADLSQAQMSGVQFGELPYLTEDSEVWSCSYSPDGKLFAVGLESGDIIVYDTSSWETIKTLSGHSERIRIVVFSPDGSQIACGGHDNLVRLWHVDTGDWIHTLTGHDDVVVCVAYSPQGDVVASAGVDGTVRLWNVATGECCHTMTGHDGWVTSVMYSPSGYQLATGGQDRTVRLWDVETGVCCRTLFEHHGVVRSVVYSPQGDMLASGSRDWSIRLWNVETGFCRSTLTGHTNDVKSVAYSPRGDLIASASEDRTVRLWDVETGTCRNIFTGHTGIVGRVAFSPKGDHVASGSSDKTVRLWDVKVGNARHISHGHNSGVLRVRYSPSGRQIATSDQDGTIRLWNAETGTCHALSGHQRHVRSIFYSPLEDLLASASDDRTVRLWDVKTGTCRHILSGHNNWVRATVYSPQGRQVASCDDDGTVRLWDVETGDCRCILTGHTNWATSIVYSPKGNKIASGSWDRTVRLWDVETGVCLYELTGHEDGILDIAYSPQGDMVASASADKTVRMWDVETGACRHVFTGHSSGVSMVTYSPKGDQLASGSKDGAVRLWNVGTGGCCHNLSGHTVPISSVAYSPKGELIASSSGDCTVRIWDVLSGQCRAMIQDFQCPINDVAWNPTSINDLVTGSEDGSVRQWQVVGDGDLCRVSLCWSSRNSNVLDLTDASIQAVHGLSRLNKQLLKQRGAVGEPFHRLRESSKKLITMASMVSKLKQSQDSSSITNHSDEQPEQGELDALER